MTSSCMDERRPQLDSTHRIALRGHPPDCSVDVSTGGEICWAEFRKSESGRMFSRASDNQLSYEWRPQLDSAW